MRMETGARCQAGAGALTAAGQGAVWHDSAAATQSAWTPVDASTCDLSTKERKPASSCGDAAAFLRLWLGWGLLVAPKSSSRGWLP